MEMSLVIETFYIVGLIAGLPLMAALFVGVGVSVLQAATQIQEQTLTFVPKLITVIVVLFVCAPWFTELFDGFIQTVFEQIVHVQRS